MLNKYGLTTILLKKRSQPQDWRLCSLGADGHHKLKPLMVYHCENPGLCKAMWWLICTLIFILIPRAGNEQGLLYLFHFKVDTVLLEEQLKFQNSAYQQCLWQSTSTQSHFLSPQHDITNLASGLGCECHIQGLWFSEKSDKLIKARI